MRLRRQLALVLSLALLMVGVTAVTATAADPDLGYRFEIDSGGQYAFEKGRQTDNNSSMSATVRGYVDGHWDVTGSLIDADTGFYTLAVGVAGTCDGNTELFEIEVTDDPGLTMFDESVAITLPSGWDFIRIYASGYACRTVWASAIPGNYGEITSPTDGEILMVGDTLNLGVDYYDNDYDPVQWAVRSGTCAANTGTVAGNVDGFSDSADWDGATFSYATSTTGWAAGDYCFIFNPTNEGGENYVRETQWFRISDGHINGGGQIIQDIPGVKKPYKVSFGGELSSFGASLECSWTVQFHKVSLAAVSGEAFHGTSCTELNVYEPGIDPTDGVVNFKAHGTFDGLSAMVLFRMEDRTEPAAVGDSIRMELWVEGEKVYDTSDAKGGPGGDFESTGINNVGSSRTQLDRGNLQIVTP